MKFLPLQPVNTIKAGTIAKYILLPGIWPRLKNLAHLVNRFLFIFVQVLGATGLIEKNHPCLKPENIGQYSFVSIFLHAWGNVKFDKQHIPQATMFFAVILSIFLIIAIIVSGTLLIVFNMGGTAQAQYFSQPDSGIPYDARDDWAFQFLERIFGGPGYTGVDFWAPDGSAGGNPWFTSILVGMLRTYSQALLFIALIMVIYLVFITLADAARSGQPFGQRFDSVWAPIRFALAIGLLIPAAGGGYNGAQLIVFQTAEFGSNLASNVWQRGVDEMSGSRGAQKYMDTAITDPGYRFVRDMFLINLCVRGYNFLVTQGEIPDTNQFISLNPSVSTSGNTTVYSWGIRGMGKGASDFCGSVALPQIPQTPDGYRRQTTVDGVTQIIRGDNNYLPRTLATRYGEAARSFMPPTSQMTDVVNRLIQTAYVDKDQAYIDVECGGQPCAKQIENWVYDYWRRALGRNYEVLEEDRFLFDYEEYLNAYNDWVSEAVRDDARFGWASAGVFYLRMSYALSILSNSVNTQPTVIKLPANFSMNYATPLEPDLDDQKAQSKCGMAEGDAICKKYAGASMLSEFIQKGGAFFAGGPKSNPDDLVFYQKAGGYSWDAGLRMREKEATGEGAIAGLIGPIQTVLFNNFHISEEGLHPLGQVVQWGDMFMNLAAYAYEFSIAMGMIGFVVPGVMGGGAATTLSQMSYWLGNFCIIPGFTLMFIVPMLPFMYFTFAVVEWIASIVEAVVGLPLWALSLITLEGDLGGSAIEGAKMLFEIMLRPTMIVFALVASILIFTATVGFFNNSIQLYMGAYGTNASYSLNNGAQIAGGMGMILVYAFAIYTLALSCFKLIDVIPNNFGRWLGIDGGLGSMMHMGTDGGNMVLGSAFVAQQAAGIGRAALMVPGGAIKRDIAISDAAKDHKKWREEETKKTTEYNLATTKHNQTAEEFNRRLPEINAERKARGERELEPLETRAYQRPPEKKNRNYFANRVDAGDKLSVGYKAGEFYSQPVSPLSGTSNTGATSANSTNPTQSSTGSGSATGTPAAAAYDPQQNLEGFYNKLNTGGPTTGRLNKLTGNSGKSYSINDLQKAFKTMKLQPNASRQQIKKQFNDLKNSFSPTTLSKNKDFKKISEAYKALNDAFDLDH